MKRNQQIRTHESLFAGDILVIVNPVAGGVNDDMVYQIVRRLAGRGSSSVEWTKTAGDAGRLTSRFGGDAGLIVVVGGDGTIAEVCAALADMGDDDRDRPALLMLPGGSGNSTVRNLWGNRDWEQVLKMATDGDQCDTKSLDLLRLVEPERTVVLGASTGFLARVLIEAKEVDAAVRGIDRYYTAAGSVLNSMPAHPTRVTVDDDVLWQGPVSSVTVGGGRFRARKFEFLPLSSYDDGLLDVCTVGALDADGVRELLPLLMNGNHLSHGEVTYGRGRRITIESMIGDPLIAEYDGDVWSNSGSKLTVDVLPDVIRVLVPRGEIA